MPHRTDTRPRPRHLVGLLFALCTVVAACGQLPDVALDDGPRPATDDGLGEPADATDPAAPADPADGRAVATERTGDGAGADDDPDAEAEPQEQPVAGEQQRAGSDEQTQQQATGNGEQQQQQQAAQPQVRGQDRTGVTDDAIHLGAHAPVTGAAPLPARAFEEASDLYWRWLIDLQDQTVLGRSTVTVEFADDRYQPSSATQVCRELASRAFAIAGAGGTDQIQACARFAQQAGVPYSSAGVTERGLRELDWYFAFSMSYPAQAELLAAYVRANFPGQRVGAIVTDTPNFDDAVEGWQAGVQREGLDAVRALRHPRGDTTWYHTFARELRDEGVDVLFILTSPEDYIRFAQQAADQEFTPQFVGVGISKGLNDVLRNGCPHVDGGEFFSPFPGLDFARARVPEFFEASEHFGTVPNDLAFAIWGQNRSVHETFQRYEQTFGTDLTREDYRALLREQRGIGGDIFPVLNYSPDNPFGASTTHVLRADCRTEEHETIHTFASSF